MSRSCKLPDCYPTSVNNFNLNDTFQNVNTEAIFYSFDSDDNEMDPVSLPIDSYDTNLLNAVGINSTGIYRIDIPSNLKVTLYSNDNFKGNSQVFYSNTTNLGNLKSNVNSLIIENRSDSNESDPNESEPADIINSNVVSNVVSKVVQPIVTKPLPPIINNSTTMETQRQLEVTNSVITNQMKSERWINGISNTTIIIIILILLLIIILKK